MKDEKNKAATENTAQHTGEGDRDAAKPAPGSGLDQRQERNAASTAEHRKNPTGGAHSQKTDPSRP